MFLCSYLRFCILVSHSGLCVQGTHHSADGCVEARQRQTGKQLLLVSNIFVEMKGIVSTVGLQ